MCEMTHQEWKILVTEYEETDSITRREEIFEVLDKTACDLCIRLEKLYNNWGQTFVCDDCYRIDRGCREMLADGFGENTAQVVYYYIREYGGVCNIHISVGMKYLDEENLEEKKEELKSLYIQKLERELERNSKVIESKKEEYEKIKSALMKVKKEMKQ